MTEPAEVANADTVTGLTNHGTNVGTVAYMSPEQVRARDLDLRTDLFSFGVVLYEMATGVMPFRGETAGVVSSEILGATPVSQLRLNPALPTALEAIIDKALEKDRDFRYQHAADIRTDLKRVQRGLAASPVQTATAVHGEVGVGDAPGCRDTESGEPLRGRNDGVPVSKGRLARSTTGESSFQPLP
jgi:serine/threonine protein kinase